MATVLPAGLARHPWNDLSVSVTPRAINILSAPRGISKSFAPLREKFHAAIFLLLKVFRLPCSGLYQSDILVVVKVFVVKCD